MLKNIKEFLDHVEQNIVLFRTGVPCERCAYGEHDKFVNLLHEMEESGMINVQDPDWFPGSPTGEKEDFGYWFEIQGDEELYFFYNIDSYVLSWL